MHCHLAHNKAAFSWFVKSGHFEDKWFSTRKQQEAIERPILDVRHTQLHPQFCGLRGQAEWHRSHIKMRKNQTWCCSFGEKLVLSGQFTLTIIPGHPNICKDGNSTCNRKKKKLLDAIMATMLVMESLYWAPPIKTIFSYLSVNSLGYSHKPFSSSLYLPQRLNGWK